MLAVQVHSGTVGDVHCCHFSYYTLFNIKYNHRVGKTTKAKRLAMKRYISVREAEQGLDTKLFLDNIPRWQPGGPHSSLLYQKMFVHVKAAGLKEYYHGICQGHQELSPERSPRWKFLLWGFWPLKWCSRKYWSCTRKSLSLRETLGKFSALKM